MEFAQRHAISDVCVLCTDIERSIGFYRDKLGFRLKHRAESFADFARTMSRFVDAMVLRVFAHHTVEEVARHASIPVVNGLSDLSHPCQALADLMTIQEHCAGIAGKTVAFVGDGNNVAR